MKPALFRYEQSTGGFYDCRWPKPIFMAAGYSGKGGCINQPDCQSVVGIGPIPQGRYRIGAARTHHRLGPVCLPLTPDAGNDMFGRSGFYIHGDNRRGDRSASSGCIILGRVVRDLIARAAGTREGAVLEVHAGVWAIPEFSLGG